MKSFESLESQDERQFPPLPSRSAMPREVRDFMREWVAVMKELPVDSPEIQGLDLKFDGFGQTLYDASSDEIESYLGGSRSYIRDGSTRSLASALHYTLKRAPRESSKARFCESLKTIIAFSVLAGIGVCVLAYLLIGIMGLIGELSKSK